MENLKKTAEVSIEMNPELVANLFCSMDADEQATFFNYISQEVKIWPVCNFDLQMQYVSDSPVLDDRGRAIMKTIGSYATI